MNKLNWINFEYIRMSDKKYIIELIRQKLNNNINYSYEYLEKIISLMSERVKTINDFVETGIYFFEEPESYEEKGYHKYINNDTKNLLKEYSEVLKITDQWTSEQLERDLRKFADNKGIKAATLIHPLRLAITGITSSPGIFELMETIGKKTVISRLKRLIEM
jgi:glutamyl-tRNA synthetase